METLKQFTKALRDKLLGAIEGGNITLANEITANLMVGAMASLMAVLMAVVWGLNELSFFSADKVQMRITAIVVIVISAVLEGINRYFHGEGKWLRYFLMMGLIFECTAMLAILGHNVTMVTIIPAILAIRYFDRRFSVFVSVNSTVYFFIATILCAYGGIENLNVIPIEDGTVITVTDGLRNAIDAIEIDRSAYVFSYLNNDYLPKAITFVLISIACAIIAKRGREMIDMQNKITTKNARIETELNLANEIQKNMLPCTFPAFPEHLQLELFAKNIPAKEVGGDFYDYFRIDSDHVALLIADVSGKGVGAALFMMISKTVIRDKLLLGLSPAEALTQANRELCENNTAGLFVTAWVGVYEVSSGKLTYVNAGHNPPIVKKSGTECYYHKSARGLVLAGIDCTVYRQQEMTLQKGDEVFLYTDGVTEATDINNGLFGEERLLNCLSAAEGDAVETQVQKVLGEISRYTAGAEQFDDITMLGMKVLQ